MNFFRSFGTKHDFWNNILFSLTSSQIWLLPMVDDHQRLHVKIWNFTSLLLPKFYYQHCFIHKTMCFLCELWKEQDHIMQGLKYKEQKTFGKRVKKIIIWCVLLMCRAWICRHTYSRPLSNTTYHLCLQWSSSNYKTTSLLRNINKRMWKSMFTFIKSNTLKIEND
jgi:hypothetical protein